MRVLSALNGSVEGADKVLHSNRKRFVAAILFVISLVLVLSFAGWVTKGCEDWQPGYSISAASKDGTYDYDVPLQCQWFSDATDFVYADLLSTVVILLPVLLPALFLVAVRDRNEKSFVKSLW